MGEEQAPSSTKNSDLVPAIVEVHPKSAVSAEEYCALVKQVVLPEKVTQLLVRTSPYSAEDQCIWEFLGMEVEDLPPGSILQEVLEKTRQQHPDWVVYSFYRIFPGTEEKGSKGGGFQQYEVRFLVPELSAWVIFSLIPAISPTVMLSARPVSGSFSVFQAQTVVPILERESEALVQSLPLTPSAQIYENGRMDFTYVLSSGETRTFNRKKLYETFRKALEENGWKNIEYSELYGVFSLSARKGNLEFSLGGIEEAAFNDEDQKTGMLIHFTLRMNRQT